MKHLQKECYDDLLQYIGLPVRNIRDQFFNWIDILDQSFSSPLTFDNQRCKTIFFTSVEAWVNIQVSRNQRFCHLVATVGF